MYLRAKLIEQVKRFRMVVVLGGILATTAIIQPSISLKSGYVQNSDFAKSVDESSKVIQADVADDMVEWLKKVLGG